MGIKCFVTGIKKINSGKKMKLQEDANFPKERQRMAFFRNPDQSDFDSPHFRKMRGIVFWEVPVIPAGADLPRPAGCRWGFPDR